MTASLLNLCLSVNRDVKVCVVANNFFVCRNYFYFSDIKGLQEVDKVEEINKQYWYACQRYVEQRAMESSEGDRSNAAASAASGSIRFREIMLCLPEVRLVAGKMLNCDVGKLPLLFKVTFGLFNIVKSGLVFQLIEPHCGSDIGC